jgi:hypothetical protein
MSKTLDSSKFKLSSVLDPTPWKRQEFLDPELDGNTTFSPNTLIAGVGVQCVMRRKPHHKPEDEDQSRRFIETAREIGADEEKSAADQLLGRLAKKPPDPKRDG